MGLREARPMMGSAMSGTLPPTHSPDVASAFALRATADKPLFRATPAAKEDPMKSLLLLTASGPLLILTSHESLHDQKLLEVLRSKGIGKFVAFEVPLSLARTRYGGHFQAVESNLQETDDLRVLDFDGQRIFQLFRFDELGAPNLKEQS
ncbi:hypothetical protein [Bradyrhizobium sp. Cp5.3]|uniref:hypothetical protein n=1 Tax=Bradyrhizobium sp. Cp5.3 TaxID=443598 RepID=UPI0004287098|nr:hypothetical protein [Bradyrhizobium sp. Cp5.3]